MHAYLILGSEAAVNTKTEELTQKLNAKELEFILQKIDDVKELNNFTKLKLGQKTAILIKDFDKATNETQNAFLKSLEEPQENLFYILTATTKDSILETIISRCQIIEIRNLKFEIRNEDKEKVDKFVKSKIGERLNITSKINKRDEAIDFANNLIIVSHDLMIKDKIKYNFAEEALKLKANLEANGNVQLQLTNFVVRTGLPSPL